MTAVAWRTSSGSTFNGNCVEVASWRTASACQGGSCVEVGGGKAVVGVRDSTGCGAGPVLTFAPQAWEAFTAGLKAA